MSLTGSRQEESAVSRMPADSSQARWAGSASSRLARTTVQCAEPSKCVSHPQMRRPAPGTPSACVAGVWSSTCKPLKGQIVPWRESALPARPLEEWCRPAHRRPGGVVKIRPRVPSAAACSVRTDRNAPNTL